MSRVRDRTIELEGIGFHLREAGALSSPSVLLLHGGGQTCRTWDPLVQQLVGRFHVVALDQRGHGDSDWSSDGDYSIKRFLKDHETVIRALDLAPLSLVGLSMGGLNAMAYAASHPRSVDALVLVDVGPELTEHGVAKIQDFYRKGHGLPSFEDFVRWANEFNPRRSLEQLRISLRNSSRRLNDGTWGWNFDLRVLDEADFALESNRAALWRMAEKVVCPTLVLQGGDSEVLSRSGAEALLSRMPNARLEIVPGASHSVVGDAPELVTEILERFLSEEVLRGKIGEGAL